MEYCYIGIFSSIFNWVLDKILSPVFNFIAKLLSTVLGWIFNEILAPLLEAVIWPLIKDALNLLMELLAGLLYGVYASCLEILDTLNSSFDYFIGLKDISFQGQSMGMLEAMFEIDGLRTAFLVVSLMGLTIAMMLAVISTMRSVLDLDFENKRPVSRVLSSLFRAFMQMFSVEVVVYVLIRLSSLILKGVNTAVGVIGGGAGNTSIARMVFIVSSMNACSSDQSLNLNGSNAASVGIGDAVRSQFYSVNGLSYTDVDVVERYFNLSKFDYLIGFVLCIFLLVVMAICMVIFVQRLFDLLMLFLVSPLFVGMIPLDDGEKFGRWRELFIGKCFSGFGIVISMKLYLMICPVIMGSSVTFSNSTELDYLTKMVFLLGGAWAVLKSGSMLTSLLNSQAGSSEDQVIGAGSRFLGGMAARGTALAAEQVGKGIAGIAASGRASKQKFEATRYHKVKGLGTENSRSISGGGTGIGGGAGISGGFGAGGGLETGGGAGTGGGLGISGGSEASGSAGSGLSAGTGGGLGTSGGTGNSGGAESSGGSGIIGSEESRGGAGIGGGAEASGGLGTSADTGIGGGAESSADTGSSGGTEAGADTGTSADTGTAGDAGTSAETGTGGGAETSAETGTDGGAGTSADTGTGAGAGSSAVTGNSAGMGTGGGASTGIGTGSGRRAASPRIKAGTYLGGGLIKSYRNEKGGVSYAFRPGKGKMLRIGKDGKGNTEVRILGFGVRYGSDGKVNKVSFPFWNHKRGQDGEMHVDRVRILNAMSLKRNDQGKLKLRDINLIGLKMGQDKDGKSYVKHFRPIGYRAGIDADGSRQVKSVMGLFRKERQADGKYHITSLGFGALQTSHVKDEDGKVRIAGVRMMGMNLFIRNDAAERQRMQREEANGRGEK